MSFARISLSLVGIAGVVAVALAGGIIWLMITQPVMVADSVAKGEYLSAREGDRLSAVRRAGGTAEVPVALGPVNGTQPAARSWPSPLTPDRSNRTPPGAC